jgi:hypothetical protein
MLIKQHHWSRGVVMPKGEFITKLVEIVGQRHLSQEREILEMYSKDISFVRSGAPSCVVWPENADEVKKIVDAAREYSFSLMPVSSGNPRLRGDTVPKTNNSVIVDLGRMNKVLRVDRKNRVVMIEPGVTFNTLIAEASKSGLRPLMPLLPRTTKSVVASCLDREPVTIPKYHWDSSDPLLCTEVVFGTGDIFRTGAAAGPGTLEEQLASGGAQKNPMGPTQFDPFRILQGAQGTMGIVTWASIKCEIMPEKRKLFFACSNKLDGLLDFAYGVLRRRLGDELFILNNLNSATVLNKNAKEIASLSKAIPKWNLIIAISGHGKMAEDELSYLEGDINDIARANGVNLVSNIMNFTGDAFLKLLDGSGEDPYWKLRLKGACQELFFLTTLDKALDHFETFSSAASEEKYPLEDLGVYIQPLVQGCSCHCEFDIYYNPSQASELKMADRLYSVGGEALLRKGAFFSRPYGSMTDAVYRSCLPETVSALKKVKSIFDPDNVMKRGSLCFK